MDKLKAANKQLRVRLKESGNECARLQLRVLELEDELENAKIDGENREEKMAVLKEKIRNMEIRKIAAESELHNLNANAIGHSDEVLDQLHRCQEAVKRYRSENERLTAEIARLTPE